MIDCIPHPTQLGMLPCPREQFDSTELGRAMAICERNRDFAWNTVPPSNRWPDAWAACYKVHTAWQNSERARQQREQEIQNEKDRQAVLEFAKGLK